MSAWSAPRAWLCRISSPAPWPMPRPPSPPSRKGTEHMKSTLFALALAAAPAAALAQAATPDTNPAHVKSGTYQVEPSHTRVLFAVSHMGFTTWYGNFTNASGNLTLDPAKLADASFDITIPANTVSTTNTKLDGELNSPEWFDTVKYPT